MEKIVKRGDIYYVELPRGVGSEQHGLRPVLVISNDTGNKYSATVIVAFITSKIESKAKLPTHCAVKAQRGLELDSLVLLEQLRTLDKTRLMEKMGHLDSETMSRIDKALAVSIGL